MKVKPECLKCEVEGAFEQANLSTSNEEMRFKAVQSFLEYLSTITHSIAPAKIGAERNRIIREVTSIQDPYSETKERMNKTAMKIKPIAEKYIETGDNLKEKLKRAIKVATVGNSFDFSVSEHEVDFSSLKKNFKEILNKKIHLNDSDAVVSKIISVEEILYLLDNPGEAILDQLLIEKIKESECDLSIAARSRPVQDDITINMAKKLDFDELGELVPSGRSPGVNPFEAPSLIQKKLDEAEFIISKGQGNFEMLSEYEDLFRGRLCYLLIGKCKPVSDAFGVNTGSSIVYFLNE